MRLIALLFSAVALVILADSARAGDWPPFDQIVSAIRATEDENAQLERENARLRTENRKLRRHVSGYGQWVRSLQRTLRHDPNVTEALNLASIVYRVPRSTLWRRARCESNLYARARNTTAVGDEHASGLLQFLPSTFASTPYAAFSIWSPYASALAGGWMMGPAKRGGEWACR